MISTRLDTLRRRRRPTPRIGDVPADQVLASGFGPLVPRRLGALVAVAVDDAGTHVWSAGRQGTLPPLDRDTDTDTDGNGNGNGAEAVFQIASITKIFTALLLADAVTTGLLALDDPVEDVLGVRLRVGGRPVTPRHLATHRAGLPFMPETATFDPAVDERDPYRTFDEQKLLRAADSALDRVKPGREAPVRYSNFGFALLGLVLARRIGTSYADALHDRVLLPAGLLETSLRPANPRAVRVDDAGELAAVQEFAAVGPAGGLWMSTADLGRWLTLLSEAMRPDADGTPTDRAHARQLVRTTMEPQAGVKSERLGLAWRLPAANALAWHNGGVPGASSFVGVDRRRATALGVFALGNSAGHLDRAAFRALTGR